MAEDRDNLPPLSPHDHPDPQTIIWSPSEMRAIRAYAAQAVAQERERCARLAETPVAGEQDDITMEAKDRVAKTIRANSPSPQPAIQRAARLTWLKDGDSTCGYNNWLASTPFGRILITWKGWKDLPDAFVDEFPGDPPTIALGSPDEVRDEAEREFFRRLALAAAPQPPSAWRPTDGWVPVTERLPEPDSGEVLVYLSGGMYALDEWHTYREDPLGLSTTHTIDMGEMWRTFDFDEVTHWQPLPPPPSAGEEKTA
jgi:hypothetical protein